MPLKKQKFAKQNLVRREKWWKMIFLFFKEPKMVLCWNGKWNRVQLKTQLANADTEVQIIVYNVGCRDYKKIICGDEK